MDRRIKFNAEKASRLWRFAIKWLAIAAFTLAQPGLVHALDSDALSVSVADTPDAKKIFIVAPKEGGGIVGGGLAVDKTGQIYVSDYGTALRKGGIYLQPKDGRMPPVEIVPGLVSPSDIEVSPDQKSLVIAGPDGQVSHKFFGVSVRVFFAKVPRDPIAFLLTSDGWISARISNDGYFHFPEVMKTQKRDRVDVQIQDETQIYYFPGKHLNTDVAGKLVGQSLIDVVIKE